MVLCVQVLFGVILIIFEASHTAIYYISSSFASAVIKSSSTIEVIGSKLLAGPLPYDFLKLLRSVLLLSKPFEVLEFDFRWQVVKFEGILECYTADEPEILLCSYSVDTETPCKDWLFSLGCYIFPSLWQSADAPFFFLILCCENPLYTSSHVCFYKEMFTGRSF